ncbi:hypothetical protein GCM10010517_45510 [Streptosporangium fragile]|uniref:B12-binding domain-containing protein n=1 Tax=Streptosporangium fragile TaxID=46186 RepID=A0ABP6IKC0_9ACTN
MNIKVTFVELSAFEAILPLASGYMQAYAQHDPEVGPRCEFEIYSAPVSADREKVIAELLDRRSDVYAISCYVWNIGFARAVLAALHERLPGAAFILGGPQVMRHAHEYVAPEQENVVVCNGEGEKTMAQYLRQILGGAPDFAEVPGISFWRGGELVTTEAAERVRDLMEVPSPFTSGVFEEGKYTTAILETNRGCPFSCGFCFWGAATNDKVHKFEDQRVRDDITWISKNNFVSLFIADANWGMAPRDVELTRHLVACSEENGYPVMVAMAAAKNKPDRMAEITEILVQGGLLTSQPISLQSMSSRTLDLVDRSNIKPETYTELQRTLREKRISSYIELIWPLPGETLESFKEGIAELCRLRADTLIIYPQLLLHNTSIYAKRDILGVQVERVPSDVTEADVVVATNWVSREEYERGTWFSYAVHSLYNLRGLYYLANYLERSGVSRFEDFLTDAATYFESRTDTEVTSFFRDSVAKLWNYDFHNFGMVAHLVLHSHREEFDALLVDFARSRPWWDDPRARAAFELDLLARPYIYLARPRLPRHDFTELRVEPRGRTASLVEMPADLAALLIDLDVTGLETGRERVTRLVLDHPRGRKLPFMPERSLEHNASYCQGMVLRLREYLPSWRPEREAAALPGRR